MIDIIKDYWKWILAFFILLVGGGICFYLYNKNDNKEETNSSEVLVKEVAIDNKVEEEVVQDEVKMVNVDIKGAVKKPGVYSLEEGSLVNDVIKMAGLKSSATTKNINLSKKVVDEMVIIVSTLKELTSSSVEEQKKEECVSNTVLINDCDGSSIIVPNGSNTKEDNNKQDNNQNNNQVEEKPTKVNINTASKDEIMTLSGIGESKALAIIKYREDNNGFKDISEIMNVSGIGESLFNKIKDFITV